MYKSNIWKVSLMFVQYCATQVSQCLTKNPRNWNRVTHLGLEPVSSEDTSVLFIAKQLIVLNPLGNTRPPDENNL